MRGGPSGVRAVVAASLAILLVPSCSSPGPAPSAEPGGPRVVIETAAGEVVVPVEVADEDQERETGLMGRESLPADAGMAFLYPEPIFGSFHMKDTTIPLSIAFWDGEGAIVSILDMEPCAADPCPSYAPGVEFAGALEVNRGFFQEHGVAVGDRVRLEGAS